MVNNSLYKKLASWESLFNAWQKAAKGKRKKQSTCKFEFNLADELLQLQRELQNETYQPGAYIHFTIHEVKKRLISAAPFRDRVVHHALCSQIEPLFESIFISDSYANRIGKGTHSAIHRFQQFAARYRYVLRLDIVKHFQSIDHTILTEILAGRIHDPQTETLIAKILKSGEEIPSSNASRHLFPGDDLIALCRPKGLPIGNLTSQFWSNCYLHPFDQFVKRELRCSAYLRYVDDFALFSNDKKALWAWKQQIQERLARFRLRIHEHSAQVTPTHCGSPWLGFVIYPSHKKLKSRKAVHASRRLHHYYNQWQADEISFATFDASVQGWINHVRHGDTWGLRDHILSQFNLKGAQW